jgi:hypothetical protein
MQDMDAFWLCTYTLSEDLVLPIFANEGDEEIRCSPCINLCLPLSFARGCSNGMPSIEGLVGVIGSGVSFRDGRAGI